MQKFKLFSILCLLGCLFPAMAQVTTEPSPLYENSQNVVIYFHADEGNKGLANLSEATPVYAHTGVITSASKDDTDWKHATDWSTNNDNYKMTYVSKNLYKLEITDLRKFYRVADSETIKKLAFVFRNANGTKTGKTASGGDILVDVIEAGQKLSFTRNIEGTVVTQNNPTVTFTFKTTEAADLWISINGNRIAEKENATELVANYTFTERGSYTIYANAKQGDDLKSTSMRLTYVIAGEQADYPGGVPKMGTVRNADGTVTFCLAAPLKQAVKLVGSWDDLDTDKARDMKYQDYNGQRYFWTNVENLDKTSMYLYYFIVDENIKCGDPYARLILDPSNDKYIPSSVYPDLPEYPTSKVRNVSLAIYQENINDYEWTDKDFKPVDKKDLVIYEMLFRDFTGTEGKANGNGTVRKAIDKIPYLKSLGVNAVELLPINEFNGNISWGYNPNFYFAPDKAYGTPDDYKDFINACHENGIAVILDLVFNQSDWQHPWYQMYSVGSNPMYNADAPHAYSVLNDWNQGHPLVRQQWKDVVKFWIEEYHVDGYRFDLVKGLGDNDSYANSGDSGTNAYNASRVANMHEIKLAMDEVNPNAYFINENLAGAKEENEMAAFGMLNWANVNYSGIQYAKGVKSGSGLQRMWAIRDSRTANSTVAYLESHDEQRLAYEQKRNGNVLVKNNHGIAMRRLGSAAAQMILCPGAHMIWQFSEMGNAQTTKNSSGNDTDPKIVNWNLLDDPDNNGLYQSYCDLIRLRTLNPDLFDDKASYTQLTADANWDNGRRIISSTATKQMIACINPTLSSEITFNVAFNSTSQDDYGIFSKSYATNPTFSVTDGTVTVPANSYVVITNNKVLAVDNIESGAAEAGLFAWGAKGVLNVDNAPAGIEIYDLNGMQMATTEAVSGSFNLPAGVYIVRSGVETAKVIVK